MSDELPIKTTPEIQADVGPTPENPPQALGGLSIFSWALTHWKLVGFGIFLITALGVYTVQRIKISSLEGDIKNLEAEKKSLVIDVNFWKNEKAVCMSNYDDLAAKIKKAGEDSANLTTAFNQFKEELEGKLKGNNVYKPAEDIRNKPTPKECSEAINFMRDHIGELQWSTN